MKKLSGVILSLLMIVVFAFGCTYADKATLNSINTKYENLTNNENYKDVIFKGKYLTLNYEGKILSAITNSNSELDENSRRFTLLKASSNVEDYENCSYYGLLSYAVNTIYLKNMETLNSPANNDKVPQKIRTDMYNILDSLENKIKDLKVQKEFLESVFDDDSRDFQIIAKATLTQDSLDRYLQSLNATLLTVLQFNNKAFDALESIQPRSLESINLLSEFANADVNSLIANAVLMVSNYVLQYDISLKNDFTLKSYDVTLINQLKEALNLIKKNYNGKSDSTKLANFKLICADENGLLNNQKLFKSAISGLSSKDFEETELSASKLARIDVVEDYKTNLSNYLTKLINFLTNV